MRVLIVPTGTANTASVMAAFDRLGAGPRIAQSPEAILAGERVIIPGVGSFGAAMATIDRLGMRQAIQDRLAAARPTLAICVGMQLLAASSEESDGTPGLGLLGVAVRRFPDEVRAPQLGWNTVETGDGCRFLTDGWGYFANSYRIEAAPPGWAVATSDHGGRFVAAMERGDVLACQFHPELSGRWGSSILSAWLAPDRAVL